MTTILEGLVHQLNRIPGALSQHSCPITALNLKSLAGSSETPVGGQTKGSAEDPIATVTAHRHHGCSIGVVLGMLWGAGDSYFSLFLGYRVTLNGDPAFIHQMAFHMFMFGGLGYFAGRFYEGRRRLQDAVRIIESQVASLKTNQEQLIQSEKLAVIGRLAASIAHEIRNPLGIMRASADLVVDDLQADHPGQEPLSFIKQEIDRLSTLIGGLLVFAKPKRPDVVDVGIHHLLDRVLTFMAPEFRKRRIQVRQTGGDPGWALADGDQIHQVLLGLLVNAVEAIHENGTVTVMTRRERDGETGRNLIRISVADDGPGIAPENISRIFEPFVTTKSEGTGLGLSVARQIIQGHDGTLEVESRPGEGATFHIVLPAGKAVAGTGTGEDQPGQLFGELQGLAV